jgi:nucleotide-binding universal stress UspA family protein
MYKHLLVPLDGSTFAEAALTAALEIADKFESRITLIRILHTEENVLIDNPILQNAEVWAGIRQLETEEAQSYLNEKFIRLDEQNYDVATCFVEAGSAAEAIIEQAAELECDLIIMSTHGRSGLGRFVYGSVASKLIRHATQPIMLIRPQPEA